MGEHPLDLKHVTIIAYDPSSVSTGFAVFQYGSLEDYGCIKISSKYKDDPVYRTRIMFSEVKSMVTRWTPDLILAEDGIVVNPKGSLTSANIMGAIITATDPCPFIKINNSTWKKGLLGSYKKNCDIKDIVRREVNRIWGIEIPRSLDDASDAVGVLTYALKSGLVEQTIRTVSTHLIP